MSDLQGADPVGQKRKLTMEFAGGLVKHLGLAMYRGAVPSLAELVANAWDADATEVIIEIPLDQPIAGQEVHVRDDGRGMTFDECQEQYLRVGRDRRASQGDLTENLQRPVMGRKGIGKLAGFGIASVVEVRTVREGELTRFQMDFRDMTEARKANLVRPYEPPLLEHRSVNEANGTTVTLRDLLISRSIPGEQFRDSMTRRFAILSASFRVLIDGVELSPSELELQFRYEGPEDGWEEVPGLGRIQWWMGFTKKPIQVADARGVRIMARGRLAQAPFFFDLSGASTGQSGMQYMTGVVFADQVDTEGDYVGTDRQGIHWDEPVPSALRRWGRDKVLEILRDRSKKRQDANERELLNKAAGLNASVRERLNRLQPSERREAERVIRTLASIESVTDDADRAGELLNLILRAFEDSSFFTLLTTLDATSQTERDAIRRLVGELDTLETFKTSEVIRARVGVVRKFKEMLESDVSEKPDMQDFLFHHPWLIDPEWQVVEHEKGLDSLLIDHFQLDVDADETSDRRVDFFCIGSRDRVLVVEVKRPGWTIGQREVQQMIDYVYFLRGQAPSSGQRMAPANYEGVLVGDNLSEDGRRWAEIAAKNAITVRPWNELFEVAERIHNEFLAVLTQRGANDARVSAALPVDDHANAAPAPS